MLKLEIVDLIACSRSLRSFSPPPPFLPLPLWWRAPWTYDGSINFLCVTTSVAGSHDISLKRIRSRELRQLCERRHSVEAAFRIVTTFPAVCVAPRIIPPRSRRVQNIPGNMFKLSTARNSCIQNSERIWIAQITCRIFTSGNSRRYLNQNDSSFVQEGFCVKTTYLT